ncbi:hypothetical protein [Absidia glauca]|uniref:C2H2-type domain-containing protein n=1 Tax=Absidia glauca TaxID=4829 RepID=A0A163LPT6_ABSGL|nr:hypothetical protein [Absidia glauca]
MNFLPTLTNNSAIGTSAFDYQQQEYMHRPTYTDMLAQSESSFSDSEQQLQSTPSPITDFYEDKSMLLPTTVSACGFDYPPSVFYQPLQPMMMNDMYLAPSHLLQSNNSYHSQQLPIDMYSSSTSPSFGMSTSSSPTFGSPDISSNHLVSSFSSSSCISVSPSSSPSLASFDLQLSPAYLSPSSSSSTSAPSTKSAVTLSSSSKAIKKKPTRKSSSPSTSAMSRIKKEPQPATIPAILKNFECTEGDCQKVFKRSEHLKRHVRSIHTKEKRKLLNLK